MNITAKWTYFLREPWYGKAQIIIGTLAFPLIAMLIIPAAMLIPIVQRVVDFWEYPLPEFHSEE